MILVICLFTIRTNSARGQKVTMDIKQGEVCSSKYKEFGLGEWKPEEHGAYIVNLIYSINNYRVVSFIRNNGATVTCYDEDHAVFLLMNDSILDKENVNYCRNNPVEFNILHNTFICFLEKAHNWYESDVGAMSYKKNEDYPGGFCFVVIEDRLISLESLSKEDLRIYRNHLFARHGHMFKSEELNSYFKSTDWYTPIPGKRITEIDLDPHEKLLLDYIKRLESKP
ncbi:MAG: YARHG domain-containing protein [Bacteroidales bacterium]